MTSSSSGVAWAASLARWPHNNMACAQSSWRNEDVVGGSSAMSGGVLWIPNNPLMQRDGVEDSYDDAMAYFKYVVGNVGPASSEERRRAYITLGPKMIEFLESLGAKFLRCEGYSDYHDEAPGASVRGRAIEAAIWEGSQLGPWLSKLQPGLAEEFGGIVLPAGEVHLFSLGFRSFATSKMVIRVVTRTVLGRLKRQKLLANGASLIGQLLKITARSRHPTVDRISLGRSCRRGRSHYGRVG